MRAVAIGTFFSLAIATASCGGKDHGGCGSARGTFPDGLTVLQWDHDTPSFSVRDKNYSITVNNQVFKLNEEPMWEGVRFDLDRPAKIYGFSVIWNHLDAVANKGGTPLEAGLYSDFGGNGFNFWHRDSEWTGTRCVSDAQLGEVDYVLDKPLEMTQPGLIYAGHFAATPDAPTWALDSHPRTGNCGTFAECHSAMDLTAVYPNDFFDGVAFSFPYDYVVRLYVEYTADPPATTVFQKVANGPVDGLRMAWGDYDNDGYDDLLTHDQNDLFSSLSVLWHNDGGAGFTNVTGSSGLGTFGGSGAWGDFDNDGCLDAFITSESEYLPDHLVRGDCAGHFTDVTDVAGVSGFQAVDPCPAVISYEQSQAAAWVDLDGDGLLDIYKATYNCGGPTSPDFVDDVYRNNGDGTFDIWTGTHGFAPYATASRGALPVDLDQDGDMDLLVQDYVLERNLYFRNVGNGSVQEIAKGNGLAGDRTYFQGAAYYGHTLGAAVGDLDGDGDFDVVEANLAHPRDFPFSDKTRVLLNTAGEFRDLSGDWSSPHSLAGLRYQETHTVPLLADFDADGKLDLALSARSDRTLTDGRPMEFYWGNGDGTFRDAMFGSGLDAPNGWGLAAADFDNDGDVDIATMSGLFRNTLTLGTNHWLQVHAVGNVTSNRAAIGATVKVHAGGKTFLRFVEGSTGQGCQDSMNLHFGLGNVSTVDSIEVHFPGGATKTYSGPIATNQRVWTYEDGTLLPGWSNPP